MLLKRKINSILNLITLCSVVLLMLPVQSMAIVNMDALHFDNVKDNFTVDMNLAISGASGNSNRSKTALNTQFTWQNEKSINLAVFGYQYGESNSIRSENKSFIHYRYIYRLNNTMDLELFTQLEKNEFTRLSYRGLLGSGLRFSVANTNQHHAFVGAGAFYSQEKIEFISGLTDDGIEKFSRANLYFLSQYEINPSIRFSNVLYYQPRLSRFSDYRALLDSKIDFKVNDNLNFRLSLDVSYDSEPSQSIKSTDISYMTGLTFNF